MQNPQRRAFLRKSAGALGAASALTMLPPSIRRALAVDAAVDTGTIKDVKHIVILMQENRGFDHYFGTHARRARLRRPLPDSARERQGRCGSSQDATAGNPAVSPRHRPRPRRCSRPARRTASPTCRPPGTRASRATGRSTRRQYSMGYYAPRRHPVPVRAGRGLHDLRRLSLLHHHRHRPEPHRVLLGLRLQPGAARGRASTAPTATSEPNNLAAGSPARCRRRATPIARQRASTGRRCPMCSKTPASAGRSTRTRTTTGPAPCTAAWPSRASAPPSPARRST